ncbi:Tetraspanin-33 [Mactra antiquata]
MACCARGDTFVSPALKYLLFFFNFMLWLCGGIMLGIGVWAYIEKSKDFYQDIQTVYDVLADLSLLLIIAGSIIFFVGYAGCIGALRENLCWLRIFYAIIIGIVLFEITIAVLAFVKKDEMRSWVSDVLKEGMILRYQDDEDAVMDWFQENIKCCGINGYKDWNKNMYFNCTKENPSGLRCGVPYSCCKDPDALNPGIPNILCGAGALNDSLTFTATSKIFTIGCIDAIIQFGEENLPIIGGVVLGIGIPQLLGICLGRLLDTQVQDQRDAYRRTHR